MYGLVIILWLTKMKFRNLAKHCSGLAKVTGLICYSQNVHGKLLILHLLGIHLYIVTFIMFVYFLKTVLPFHIIFFKETFGVTWTITYSKKLHSLKTSAESFLRLILGVFLYLLRAVKPFS